VAEVRPQAMGAYELFVSADADAGIDTAITGPEKVDETYFSVAQFSIRNFEAVQSNPNDPYAPMPISEDGLPEIVITNEFVKIPDMPQTGDESDILLWLSLALSSMTALMLVSRKKREV
jgi:LPXTG-motif cell wall-anchored protein